MQAEGLGIGLPLDQILNPKTIKLSDIKLEIIGLGVQFNKPPLVIAGAFRMEKNELFEEYLGGLMITVPPYSVTAVGAYRRDLVDNFKSVFIFGRLDGPLFTLEIAEVSGVSVSFGYNYDLRTPKGFELENYPLLSNSLRGASDNSPMAMIAGSEPYSFRSWLSAEKDHVFFSVGLKIASCHVLYMEAALVFGIGVGQFKVSLVGRGTGVFPPAGPGVRSPITFMYAEIGMIATLDITGGSLILEAALSSNSYVLSPFCHVSGGFALCYWFSPNAQAGDWMFSLGGFHPAFAVPSHWPVPARLGMAWEISDVLRVGGEAYFAITPRAVMGGGRLFANFNAGPIYADFEAWANFLINFDPFYFIADIGVRIRVGARFSIGFIRINISASVSAELHLQGPPFGGYVDIDFKIIDVRIHFGQANSKPALLPRAEFPPAPGPAGEAQLAREAGKKGEAAMVVMSLEAGAATELVKKFVNENGDSDQSKWFVYPGMNFRVETRFAISHVLVTQYESETAKNEADADPVDTLAEITALKDKTDPRVSLDVLQTNKIYARPCQISDPITSLLRIDITPADTVTIPDPTGLAVAAASASEGQMWRKTVVKKALPSAMWGQYTNREDPTVSGNNSISGILSASAKGEATIEHIVGFSFRPPPPDLPDLNFAAFSAAEAMSESVFARGSQAAKSETKDGTAKMKNGLLIRPENQAIDRRPRFPVSGGVEMSPNLGDLKEWFTGEIVGDADGNVDKEADRVWDDVSEWKEVIGQWGAGDEVGLTDLAGLVGEAFGWGLGTAADAGEGANGVKVVKTLSGKVPSALLADVDQYYMSCPWVVQEA